MDFAFHAMVTLHVNMMPSVADVPGITITYAVQLNTILSSSSSTKFLQHTKDLQNNNLLQMVLRRIIGIETVAATL